MADEHLQVYIHVHTEALTKAQALAKKLEATCAKPLHMRINTHTGGLDRAMIKTKALSNSVAVAMNSIGTQLAHLGASVQRYGRTGIIGTALTGAVGVAGISKLVKAGISTAVDIENAQQLLTAQGVTGSQRSQIEKRIRTFAEQSPFDIKSMTDSVARVNSYVNNIEKAEKATEIFGTSMMASGRSASDLQRVAVNLGELDTGAFTKIDWKELVKGVPAISAALKDIGIDSWEKFNEALGDDPKTKTIERTGNALDLLMNALDRWNIKTNALAESNKSLRAQTMNTFEIMKNRSADLAKSSGLFDNLKVMLGNVAEAFDKNKDSMEGFYRFLGVAGVKLSEYLKTFDFGLFFATLKSNFSKMKSEFDSFIKPFKPALSKLKNYLTGGASGAEALANAFSKIVSISSKLFVGGALLKGLGNLTRYLSAIPRAMGFTGKDLFKGFRGVGGFLAGMFAPVGQAKVTAAVSKSVGGPLAIRAAFSKLFSKVGAINPGKALPEVMSKWSSGIAETISSLFGSTKLFKNLPKNASLPVSGILTNVRSSVSSLGKGIGSTFSKLNAALPGLVGSGLGIGSMVLAINSLKTLPDMDTIKSGFAKVAAVSAGMSVLSGVTDKLASLAKVDLKKANLSQMFGAISFGALALSLKQLNDLPDKETVASGFAKIGAVSLGMSTLSGITDKVSNNLKVDLFKGGFVQLLNALDIGALAIALKQLNNLPDWGVISSASLKIGVVAAGMSGLNAAVSALNSIKFVNIKEGAILQLLNALDIGALTIAMKQFKDLPDMDVVINGIKKISGVALAMTAVNTISGLPKVSKFAAIGAGINALGALNVGLLAHVTKQLGELPDADSITSGFLKITGVALAMDALNVTTGALAIGFKGIGGVLDVLGAAINALNALSIETIISVANKLGSLPDAGTIETGFSKLINIAEKLGTFQSELGKITASNPLEALLLPFKAFFDSFAADEINQISKSITSISEAGKALAALDDVRLEWTGIEKKIDKMGSILGKVREFVKGGSGNNGIPASSQAAIDAASMANIYASFDLAINSLATASDKLKAFDAINIPDTVTDKIDKIVEVLKYIDSSASAWNAMASSLTADVYDNMFRSLDGIVKSGEKFKDLNKIESLDIESLTTVIEDMKRASETVAKLKGISSRLTGIAEGVNTLTTVSTSIKTLGATMKDLVKTELPRSTDLTELGVKLDGIVSFISNSSLTNAATSELTAAAENSSKIVTAVSEMGAALKSLTDIKLPSVATITELEGTITTALASIDRIINIELKSGDTDVSTKFGPVSNSAETLSTLMSHLSGISTQLKNIQETALDSEKLTAQVRVTLDGLQSALTSLYDIFNKQTQPGTGLATDFLGGSNETFEMKIPSMEVLTGQLKNIVNSIKEMSDALAEIQKGVVVAEQVEKAIQELFNAVGRVVTAMNEGGGGNNLEALSKYGSVPDSDTGPSDQETQISKIINFANSLTSLQDALSKILEAQFTAEQLGNAVKTLFESLKAIIDQFNTPMANQVGAGIGQGSAADTILASVNSFVEKVKQAVVDIGNISPDATAQGKNLGDAVITGFSSADWSTLLNPVKTALEDAKTIGSDAGSALKTGFDEGVTNLATTAVTEIDKVKVALDSIPKSVDVSVNVSSNVSSIASQIASLSNSLLKSKGGFIPGYATGGLVGNKSFGLSRRGTDKIPAMLTHGEFVQNRNAVNFWGRDLFDAMNNRNIDRVSQLMMNKLGTLNSTKVYNTYYNTTTNANINQQFSAGDSMPYRNLTRFIRG